jgi:hypothetical protein
LGKLDHEETTIQRMSTARENRLRILNTTATL